MAQSRELSGQTKTATGFAAGASLLATGASVTVCTPGATGYWGRRNPTLCRNPSGSCPECFTAWKRNLPWPLVAVKHTAAAPKSQAELAPAVSPSAGWVSHKPSSPHVFPGSKGHTPQSPQVYGAGSECQYPQSSLEEADGCDDRAIPTFL